MLLYDPLLTATAPGFPRHVSKELYVATKEIKTLAQEPWLCIRNVHQRRMPIDVCLDVSSWDTTLHLFGRPNTTCIHEGDAMRLSTAPGDLCS